MLAQALQQHASSAGESTLKRSSASSAVSPDPLSAVEQAEPYRLVTAIFPIDVLTPVWKRGINRSLNIPHQRRLCHAFGRELHRTDLNNALRLICSRQEVDRMISELKRQGQTRVDWRQRTSESWPAFLEWQRVNPELVELMAGHHRVEALKEHLKDAQDAKGESWWLCDVYDRDTLPLELSIQLRANREDLTLPDTHGHIWTELGLLARQDVDWHLPPAAAGPSGPRKRATTGLAKSMEAQLTQKLGLTGKTTFPVRRLGTLWRNEPWRGMIDEWCQFPLGLATFNITTWEWMSSCRVDDFWFSIFRAVIHTLRTLREQHHIEVPSSEWIRLSRLPQPRQCQDVQDLFLPDLQPEGDISEFRAKNFFANLDDSIYDKVYNTVLRDSTVQFPDVHALLKTTCREGKILRTVISHVGQWLNRDVFQITDRASEKPPLWQDLRPGVKERYPDNTDAQCVELQRRILIFTQQHYAEFTHVTVAPLLHILPRHGNATEFYVERFKHAVWQDLLKLVYEFCGPSFQHDALSRFNRDSPSTLCDQSSSIIAQSMCQVLENIPEIIQNPALRSKEAVKDLLEKIEPIVLRWAIRHCEVRGEVESAKNQTESVNQEQLVRYRGLLARHESSSKEVTSQGVAPREKRSPRYVTPPSTTELEVVNIDEIDLASSAVDVDPESIQPRPMSSRQKNGQNSSTRTKRRRDSTDSPLRAPGIYRQLDDMLEPPSQPRKLKSQEGRGWRTRPVAHADPKPSH